MIEKTTTNETEAHLKKQDRNQEGISKQRIGQKKERRLSEEKKERMREDNTLTKQIKWNRNWLVRKRSKEIEKKYFENREKRKKERERWHWEVQRDRVPKRKRI